MDNEKNTEKQPEETLDVVSESDLVFEEDAEGESASMDARGTIAKLRSRLKKAEEEKQEYLDGWQRTKADFINTRKRDEENNRDFAKFARSDLILDIVNVLDSFDMAVGNKTEWEKLPPEWRKGMEGIRSQLLSILNKNGLKELNPIGEEFNPALEEAAGFIDTEKEEEDGKILQILQKGYFIHEKLIRPAKVKIGRKLHKE